MMHNKDKNYSLPLLTSLVFLFPIVFSPIHKELAHIRNWQLLITVLLVPLFIHIRRKSYAVTFDRISLAWCALSALGLYSVSIVSAYYAIAVNGVDFSIFDHMLLHTKSGEFMHTPFYAYSHFAIHPSWIVLLLVPFHRLAQDPLFLLVMGNVLLWSAIFPLWKLAKQKKLDDLSSGLLCFVYLTSPFVGTVVNTGFRIESFIPLISLSFFFCWEQRKKVLSHIFLLLWLSIKEDMALYALGFFFYTGIFQKNRRAETILGASLSLAVLVLNVGFVQPYFLQGVDTSGPEYLHFWKSYGSSKEEILRNLLSSPLHVLSDIFYSGWWKLYAPLLIVPLMSGPVLFASLPGIFILGTANSYPNMHQYGQYYPLLLFCLALLGILNILSEKNFLRSFPWAKEWVLPFLLIATPLLHTGYIKVMQTDFAMHRELKEAQVYLEQNYPQSPICTQTIAFPYLGYKLKLEPLSTKCLKQEGALALFVSGKDPYPYSQEEIQKMQEQGKEVKGFGGARITTVSSKMRFKVQ